MNIKLSSRAMSWHLFQRKKSKRYNMYLILEYLYKNDQMYTLFLCSYFTMEFHDSCLRKRYL